jgi:site-specific recombinase XerD
MASFPTERARNDAVAKLIEGIRKQGEAAFEYDPKEWKAYVAFKAETGATLEDLRKLWASHHQAVRPTMKTREAVTRYLALRLAEDMTEKSDTYRHIKKALTEHLAKLYGERLLGDVRAEDVRDLLSRLKDRKGKGEASSTTKRNYRKYLSTFFARAVREKWAFANPCADVVPPKLVSKDAAILTLPEVFKLFQEARNSPIGARLAVEAFAGLRVSSSARLTESEIFREEGALVLPASKHKLEKRFFVEGFPENLFAWLDLPNQRWDISESYYDKLKGDVFRAAKVVNPGNVLRHSFCTYHLAAFRDASRTATLLTHRNPTMLYQHYRGKGVTQAEGLAYFRITPGVMDLNFSSFLTHTTHATQRPIRGNLAPLEPDRGRESGPSHQENHPRGVGSGKANPASETIPTIQSLTEGPPSLASESKEEREEETAGSLRNA